MTGKLLATQNVGSERVPLRDSPTATPIPRNGPEDLQARTRPRATAVLVAIAAAIELSFLLLHTARTEATQVALVLVAYGVGGIAFASLLGYLKGVIDRRPGGAQLACVFLAAIAFRLTLLPLDPASSTDVFRYLWEGIVQTEGFNPYTTPPDDPMLAHLAEEHGHLHTKINHPSIPTIYPPVAQLLFLLNARAFGGSLFAWKMVLLAFDVLLTATAWGLLHAWRRPIWPLCFVLWCPLLMLETYEGGHLDLIGATLIVIALLAHEKRKPLLVGIALGLAFNVKYPWPVLVLILLLFRGGARRDRIKTLLAASVVAAVCWIPFLRGLPAALSTMRTFAEDWSFNGAVLELLRVLPGPAWLPAVLTAATLVFVTVLLTRRPADGLWSDVWLAFGAALLLMPAAFPWYFIWLVPGLLAYPPRWLVLWISLVPFLHVVDWHLHATGQWQRMPWLWIVVGIAPTILLITAWWRRIVRTRTWNPIPCDRPDLAPAQGRHR